MRREREGKDSCFGQKKGQRGGGGMQGGDGRLGKDEGQVERT